MPNKIEILNLFTSFLVPCFNYVQLLLLFIFPFYPSSLLISLFFPSILVIILLKKFYSLRVVGDDPPQFFELLTGIFLLPQAIPRNIAVY